MVRLPRHVLSIWWIQIVVTSFALNVWLHTAQFMHRHPYKNGSALSSSSAVSILIMGMGMAIQTDLHGPCGAHVLNIEDSVIQILYLLILYAIETTQSTSIRMYSECITIYIICLFILYICICCIFIVCTALIKFGAICPLFIFI